MFLKQQLCTCITFLKQQLCTCSTPFGTIFFALTARQSHEYDVKLPNLTFYGGRKRNTTISFFPFYGMVWYGMVTLFIHGKSFSKDYKMKNYP